MVKQVSVMEAMKGDYVFVDVRSPGEFEEGHIPGAINIFLLDDEQRAVVGILYKQDKDKALKVGYGLVEPRFKEIKERLLSFDRSIVVYCWRGGMRSKAVVELAGGAEVYQLKDGYKEYRAWVRERLKDYKIKASVIVIHGYTCSGKTKILQELDNVVDLEGLAQHRGSVFGAMGLKPRKQKMFDSLLLKRLDELVDADYIVFEGESKKIGDLHIAPAVFKAMQEGIHLLLKVDVSERAKLAVEEYDILQKKEEFLRIVKSLRSRIGGKNVDLIIGFVENDDFVSAAKILLEKYYDPLYEHSLNKYKYIKTISEDLVQEVKKFLNKF